MIQTGVDFTNILRAAFKCADPKCAKRQSSHQLGSAVNFINILRTNFSYKYDISAAFPNYMYVEKAAETPFVQKTRAYNVDEIDTWFPFPTPKPEVLIVNKVSKFTSPPSSTISLVMAQSALSLKRWKSIIVLYCSISLSQIRLIYSMKTKYVLFHYYYYYHYYSKCQIAAIS